MENQRQQENSIQKKGEDHSRLWSSVGFNSGILSRQKETVLLKHGSDGTE
jgi:hypothetical protein